VPDHPDHEQLAAFQAGDGDRRQLAEVEAHLAGCPSCAAVVASVERARQRLALLEEPDLPPGLHDRLAAAVASEAATAPAARPAARVGRGGSGTPATGPRRRSARVPGSGGLPERGARVPGARPVPWFRRPVAWGAAAALLLAALVAVPLLDRSSNRTAAGGSGGGQAAQDLAGPEAAGAVPVIRVAGDVSAATVRARLAGDPRAKAALAAAGRTPGGTAPPAGGTGSQVPTPGPAARPPGQTGSERSGAATAGTASAALQACLSAATAAAGPATRPLIPAFYLEGGYRGRPATVLVTASTGQPGRVDLWAFPRGGCSGPPLATERVR
jgi:hypothetical protein